VKFEAVQKVGGVHRSLATYVSTYSNMYRKRLETVICMLHESINTMEIARQLSGKAENKVLTLPAVEFEP
jgi:hypothetical protein